MRMVTGTHFLHYFFFFFNFRLIWKAEKDQDYLSSFGSFLHMPTTARIGSNQSQKPGVQSWCPTSGSVPKNLCHSCCLPGRATAGSRIWKQSQNWNPGWLCHRWPKWHHNRMPNSHALEVLVGGKHLMNWTITPASYGLLQQEVGVNKWSWDRTQLLQNRAWMSYLLHHTTAPLDY